MRPRDLLQPLAGGRLVLVAFEHQADLPTMPAVPAMLLAVHGPRVRPLAPVDAVLTKGWDVAGRTFVENSAKQTFELLDLDIPAVEP